jgi:hypothetical protein
MSRPSVRGRGPSGPAVADPIFRSELPRPAPKPPHAVQTLDNPFGPSAYGARQSEYNVGRSAYLTEYSYRRPYDSQFDRLPYLQGTRIPEFVKFSGDQEKSTREHIDQFLAQISLFLF